MEQTSKNRSQFGLKSATRLHEVGIASNRRSATLRWIRSRVLYTPPVKPWELVMPEVGLLRNCLRQDWWLGLSRNKVSLRERGDGLPPFYGVHLSFNTIKRLITKINRPVLFNIVMAFINRSKVIYLVLREHFSHMFFENWIVKYFSIFTTTSKIKLMVNLFWFIE